MKTFEEILKEVLINHYEIRTDIAFVNFKGRSPNLWEAIKEAAEEYVKESINDHYEKLRDALVGEGYRNSMAEGARMNSQDEVELETETPQSNGRIIKEVGKAKDI